MPTNRMTVSALLRPILVLLLFASWETPTLSASDLDSRWNQWRGPDRSGVSGEVGLLAKWPSDGPELLFKISGLGDGFSSLAFDGEGRVYTLGMRDKVEYVLAYDLETKKEVWTHELGASYRNRYGDGPRSTPTIDGDRLYCLGANGDLACLDRKSGKRVWKFNTLVKFKARNIKWGISESPLVEGGTLIITPAGLKGTMVALDKKSGRILWTSQGLKEKNGYSSALAVTVDGVRQIIQFTGRSVVGVRAKDGKLLWQNKSASNKIANCATPIYSDGKVFVTSGYGTGGALLSLNGGKGQTRAKEVYFTKDMQNHHGGVVLLDGYVYGYSSKSLNCLDFETGELKWRDRSVGKGAVTAADGMLYVLSEEGRLGLVKAQSTSYEEVSAFDVPIAKGPSWTCPVIFDGRLYIRCLDDLFCYDIRKRS